MIQNNKAVLTCYEPDVFARDNPAQTCTFKSRSNSRENAVVLIVSHYFLPEFKIFGTLGVGFGGISCQTC